MHQINEADKVGNHKNTWRIIRELNGDKARQNIKIKGETRDERLESWYDHFKGLRSNSEMSTSDMT